MGMKQWEVDELIKKIERGEDMIPGVLIISATICTDCGNAFIIDSNEYNRNERNGRHQRKHCENCLSLREMYKNKHIDGRELMSFGLASKNNKHERRVGYA